LRNEADSLVRCVFLRAFAEERLNDLEELIDVGIMLVEAALDRGLDLFELASQ
jgi:hypothetical protein